MDGRPSWPLGVSARAATLRVEAVGEHREPGEYSVVAACEAGQASAPVVRDQVPACGVREVLGVGQAGVGAAQRFDVGAAEPVEYLPYSPPAT